MSKKMCKIHIIVFRTFTMLLAIDNKYMSLPYFRPNGDRLRAQHDRSIMELEMERGIEEAIKARLSEAQYVCYRLDMQ